MNTPIRTFTIQSDFVISVYKMTLADIHEWQTFHQPAIAQEPPEKRADQDWNWYYYYVYANLYNTIHNTKGFVYRIDGIIVGMAIHVFNYQCIKDITKRIDHYAWLISASPAYDFLIEKYNIDRKKVEFAKILLERLTTHADINGKMVWLHKDPKASVKLKHYYTRLGFRMCPSFLGENVRPLGARTQDYNYLYLQPQSLREHVNYTKGIL